MSKRRSTSEPVPPDRCSVPQPEKTAQERAEDAARLRVMQDLVARLQQDNLNQAVRLAQQAAAGHGPLVEHFAELGRVWSHLLYKPVAHKAGPKLSVVEGGAS